MKDMRNDELLRLSMKPQLSAEEEARLEALFEAEPAQRLVWEQERALSRALHSLADVPVANNFTSRVMQAIDGEESSDRRARESRPGFFGRIWPRLIWGGAALLAVLVGAQQYQAARRTQLAKDVVLVSKEVSQLPSPEILQDFDVINELRQVSMTSDDELLTALQ